MQKTKGGPGFVWRIPFLVGFNYYVYLAKTNFNAEINDFEKTIHDFNNIKIEVTRDWDSEKKSGTDNDNNQYEYWSGDEVVFKWK